MAGIDEELVRKINNINATNTYVNSIKGLILSWHFAVTDKEKQVEMLRQAIALDPNNVESYIQLGRIFIDQGN
ncbi:lipopolysaccharide assembly protein LapB, partial [Paenibacillus sp. P3E]|uniref:tetratricopeptide repeat protein n=1 Tax=Paenibacillus sp. P3E TaxID=1349435 RepID=UPI001C4A405B